MSSPTEPTEAILPKAGAPFRQELSDKQLDSAPVSETEFEKRRGINRVELRKEMAQARVWGLAHPITESRLAVLRAIRDAEISIDFVKLATDGLSFVIPESRAAATESTLKSAGVQFSLERGRCIMLVHAANMRDEEGLIARIVSEVIASGAHIDHLGDMHDRILLVTASADADALAARIEDRLMEGPA